MQIDNDLLVKFFDITYIWKNDIPKIILKLKNSLKIINTPCLRKDNRPNSGATEKYYVHYLGEVIGKKVYAERRKLFNKMVQIDWYIETFAPDDAEKLLEYKNSIGNKISKHLLEHYSSPAGEITKQKLKVRSEKWAPIIGKLNAERWKNNEWKSAEMERRKQNKHYERLAEKAKLRFQDPEYVQRFLVSMRDPSRVEKIRIAAKAMWADAKKNDLDKYYRMLYSAFNKNYVCNNIQMNSIEYQLAMILTELEIKWDYEVGIKLESRIFVPDFTIRDKKIIIEAYGDFWHANPKSFKSTDTTHKTRTAADVWSYDAEKKRVFEKNGYLYLVFWEEDILRNVKYIKESIKNEIC